MAPAAWPATVKGRCPMFKKAERKNLRIRLALVGPTGSGKTYTALQFASVLADGGTVAVIDTERSSADRYADRFTFDACQLTSYSPEEYTEAIVAAGKAGYSVLVIDSLSHAWEGQDGLLERADAIAKRSKSGNSFTAWKDATPLHRRLIDTVLAFPGHVIVTMRAKMDYIQEKDSNGRTQVRKVGLAPVQRAGVEYEFDLVADIDQEHNLMVTKSRAVELDGLVANRPGPDVAEQILAWANGGTAPADPLPPSPSSASADPVCPVCSCPGTGKPKRGKDGSMAQKCGTDGCPAEISGWFRVGA